MPFACLQSRVSSYLFLGFVLLPCFASESGQAIPLQFEVASVRLAAPNSDPASGIWSPPGIGKFAAAHVTLERLIQLAYGVNSNQILHKPDWLETSLYDVEAKPESGVPLTRDELRPRLQNLLATRFHLTARMEVRQDRGYALVATKAGARLTPTKGDHFPGFRLNVSPGEMRGANWTLPQFASYLSSAAGFPVVDETGITGSYDISFSYAAGPEEENEHASLEAALEQATGLTLRPQRVPVQVIFIESVSRTPTEN